MPKAKEGSLTKKDWKFLCNVFDQHLQNAEDQEKTEEHLFILQTKIFWLDAQYKQQKE